MAYELKQQPFQQEQDEKANEEQARKDPKLRKSIDFIQQFLGKRPNLNQIIACSNSNHNCQSDTTAYIYKNISYPFSKLGTAQNRLKNTHCHTSHKYDY